MTSALFVISDSQCKTTIPACLTKPLKMKSMETMEIMEPMETTEAMKIMEPMEIQETMLRLWKWQWDWLSYCTSCSDNKFTYMF